MARMLSTLPRARQSPGTPARPLLLWEVPKVLMCGQILPWPAQWCPVWAGRELLQEGFHKHLPGLWELQGLSDQAGLEPHHKVKRALLGVWPRHPGAPRTERLPTHGLAATVTMVKSQAP